MAEETTRIGIDDGCKGLETPDGRVFHARDNVVELPTRDAEGFLRSDAAQLHRHRRVGSGWTPTRERALARIFGKE